MDSILLSAWHCERQCRTYWDRARVRLRVAPLGDSRVTVSELLPVARQVSRVPLLCSRTTAPFSIEALVVRPSTGRGWPSSWKTRTRLPRPPRVSIVIESAVCEMTISTVGFDATLDVPLRESEAPRSASQTPSRPGTWANPAPETPTKIDKPKRTTRSTVASLFRDG